MKANEGLSDMTAETHKLPAARWLLIEKVRGERPVTPTLNSSEDSDGQSPASVRSLRVRQQQHRRNAFTKRSKMDFFLIPSVVEYITVGIFK